MSLCAPAIKIDDYIIGQESGEFVSNKGWRGIDGAWEARGDVETAVAVPSAGLRRGRLPQWRQPVGEFVEDPRIILLPQRICCYI